MSGAGDGQHISVGDEAAVEAFPQDLQQFIPPAQQLVSLPPVGEGNAFLDDSKIICGEFGKYVFIFFRNIFLQSDSSFRDSFCLYPFNFTVLLRKTQIGERNFLLWGFRQSIFLLNLFWIYCVIALWWTQYIVVDKPLPYFI